MAAGIQKSKGKGHPILKRLSECTGELGPKSVDLSFWFLFHAGNLIFVLFQVRSESHIYSSAWTLINIVSILDALFPLLRDTLQCRPFANYE